MKVLVLSNGELKEKEINNGLENLQEIVGGYIEIPYLGEAFRSNGIDVIINEEGKFIEGLKPEIAVVKSGDNQILDLVMGNCIFASHDDEGNTVSLNEKQILIVKRTLKTIAMIKMKDKDYLIRTLFI